MDAEAAAGDLHPSLSTAILDLMSKPDDYFPEFPLEWEMSVAERFTLVGLLDRLRPEVAIEIGTHHGGSLQVLARFCRQVHSIDLDPAVCERLSPKFPRVRFHTGPSRDRIPEVLHEIEASAGRLGFVLVDGDHTARGVQADIEALLRHRPKGSVHVLLHDSFNPACRAGMHQAAWAACPHVKSLDLDFVPGKFCATPEGGAFARSMWGGFALAVLDPELRSGPLVSGFAQEAMQRIMFRHSAHRIWHKILRRIRRVAH